VGKSTLLNRLAGFKLSAVTPKPQTTRQNIIAICEGKNYQAVFSDTPGYITAQYKLQKFMVASSLRAIKEDADLICLVIDATTQDNRAKELTYKIKQTNLPCFLVINKIDIITPQTLVDLEIEYKKLLPFKEIFKISALTGEGVSAFKDKIIKYLPSGKPYYPKGQITDRWERFYAGETIREQIFKLYKQEIPYSCAVEIEEFAERPGRDFIKANIYVERESQKPIIIGKNAKAIKTLREKSASEIEKFLGRKIILSLQVKTALNWRNDIKQLKRFGF
jgi:GTP-binding protein Era